MSTMSVYNAHRPSLIGLPMEPLKGDAVERMSIGTLDEPDETAAARRRQRFRVAAGACALLFAATLALRVAATAAGRVELRANATGGPLLASCAIRPTGGLDRFEDVRCPPAAAALNGGAGEVELVAAVLREDERRGEFLRVDSLRLA